MKSFDLGRVPPVTFGAGSMARVPEIVAASGEGPVFVIADAALAANGVTDRLSESLSAKGIAHDIAADVAGEPKETLAEALCQQARESSCNLIIGIGGGAAMDTAKLVAAIARSGLPACEFALSARALPSGGIPAIAVPTTAGTGSEVTRTAIVSTPEGVKNWYWGEELMFAHAVLDPELTLTLPPHLTAWTGIDAVAHALEASTARSTNPGGHLFGLEALRILARALPRAVADGTDVEARGQMLWASMVAGLALHNCNTHMGHNISHALGSLAPVHHGLATGLALDVSLPWLTARQDGEANYALAAEALGGEARASALPVAFSALMRSCQIPAELPAVCATLTAKQLSDAMKSSANYSMSQNAACPIGFDDLDEIAALMMDLPRADAGAA